MDKTVKAQIVDAEGRLALRVKGSPKKAQSDGGLCTAVQTPQA